MQAYISTNKSVAFNIHPKQHYVKENQWITRDEGKTVYIPGSLSNENQILAFSVNFPSCPSNFQKLSTISHSRQWNSLPPH